MRAYPTGGSWGGHWSGEVSLREQPWGDLGKEHLAQGRMRTTNTLGTRERSWRSAAGPGKGSRAEGTDLDYVSQMQPASGYYHSYFTGKEKKAQ